VNDRRVEITVSFRTLVLITATIALALALASIKGALLLLFTALFLALALEPVVVFLQGRGLSRGIAATVVVLTLLLLFAVLVTTVLVPLVQSVHDLIIDLPKIVESIRQSRVFRAIDKRWDVGGELQKRVGSLAEHLPSATIDLVGLGGTIVGVLFRGFTAAFLTLYLLIDLPRIERALHSVLEPRTSARVASLRLEITRTISRYALGAALIGTIAGAIEGTSAWLLGAPFPLALALLAGLLDLIPQVGATIAGIALVLVTLTAGVSHAVAMLVVVIVYQQLENYVLQPTIQGRSADVSGFFIVGGVVMGAALLGVLGALVAVPVIAATQIVLRELTAERRARIAALHPIESRPA
jgi:predicted PurR-regulated permease PerM